MCSMSNALERTHLYSRGMAPVSAATPWARIEAALDELLALPLASRAQALIRIAAGDGALHDELASLLSQVDGEDGLLDTPAVGVIAVAELPGSLPAGHRIGPYKVVALVGRGGMGEVYRAERATGDFRQIVALKLVRSDAISSLERFHAERQILAELNHPGIARLLDGGVTDDGRPYMAMEYVEGHNIVSFCEAQRAPLELRLRLFLQICDAVAYAQAHLVVHRDLKPGNIFVTPDGRVKLLDFGIATLLRADGIGDATHTAHLSPAHAAPEQLTGAAITTATDVYALGVTLYQMLCGRLPWQVTDMALGAAVQRLLHEIPPLPSAAVSGNAPVTARELKGDLDSIIAKALRREPQDRYPDARALANDITRHLQHEPVNAREGARAYVLRRFLRRHWVPLSAIGAVFAALLIGIVGIAWEAAQAKREAARATATKNFLVSVFEVSGPRIASDKPRDQITAKDLLDASSERIERDFSADAEDEIALLGMVADIYNLMNDSERAEKLHRREVELARAVYGDLNPIAIEGMLDDVTVALQHVDQATARRRLDSIDVLIRRAGLDRSVQRARWWLQQAQLLWSDQTATQQRTAALENSVRLYAAVDPINEDFPVALNELGRSKLLAADFVGAIACFERAIVVAQQQRVPEDSVLVTVNKNLALALTHDNQRARAEQVLVVANELARKTYGLNNRHYWEVAADAARMVHEDGERVRAMDMFDQLLRQLPPDESLIKSESDRSVAARVRETYGTALVAEGRTQLGISFLESAESVYATLAREARDLPRVHLQLADAYERSGRIEDARQALQASLDGYLAQATATSEEVLMARERWGRLLLTSGDLPGADAQLSQLVPQAQGRYATVTALAQGDRARLALAQNDAAAALRYAREATSVPAPVNGARDVRTGPYLWRIYAQALAASGDQGAARDWATKALAADLAYDDPSSPDIAADEQLLRTIKH
jgi:eukaryotic-like serine/threonine-protein kinase